MMNFIKFLHLLSLASLLIVPLINIECMSIDNSSPDLSMFKLKPVDLLARKKSFSLITNILNKPIEDIATGANLLRESFYSDDLKLRCVAYGQLMKIFHSIEHPKYYGIRPVFRDTIDALVIVSDVDKEIYWKLFQRHKVSQLPELFSQTIRAIEAKIDSDSGNNYNQDNLDNSETWFELINCAETFVPALKQFLNEPRRVKAIEQFKSFKAIPVPAQNDQVEEERVKLFVNNKIVNRLRNKFENAQLRFTDEQDIGEAKIKVELYDDYEAFELKRQHDNEKDNSKETPNDRLELIAYERTMELFKDYSGKVPTSESKIKMLLDILKFRRDRLELIVKSLLGQASDHLVKFSIQSAYEFVDVWTELEAMQPRLNVKLGDKVKSFLEDPRNREALERMKLAIEKSNQLMDALYELSLLNGQKGRLASSIDELNAKYDQVDAMLRDFDTIFDTSNEYRRLAIELFYQKNQFNVLNNFIKQNSW